MQNDVAPSPIKVTINQLNEARMKSIHGYHLKLSCAHGMAAMQCYITLKWNRSMAMDYSYLHKCPRLPWTVLVVLRGPGTT